MRGSDLQLMCSLVICVILYYKKFWNVNCIGSLLILLLALISKLCILSTSNYVISEGSSVLLLYQKDKHLIVFSYQNIKLAF